MHPPPASSPIDEDSFERLRHARDMAAPLEAQP